MISNVCVIGAGRIGSRHVQSLGLLNRKINVFVIDPCKDNLDRTKKLFFNNVANRENINIQFYEKLNKFKAPINVSIISTNSDVRRDVIEQLISINDVENMILEKIDKPTFQLIHDDLVKNGFECLQGNTASDLYDDYLIKKTNIRYVKNGELVPEMELKLEKDQLDNIQIKEREKFPITNIPLWFSSIEANIAYKETFLKSPKDMEDAKHLRIMYGGKVNNEKIKYYERLIRQLRE